jgi:hypothetical protein
MGGSSVAEWLVQSWTDSSFSGRGLWPVQFDTLKLYVSADVLDESVLILEGGMRLDSCSVRLAYVVGKTLTLMKKTSREKSPSCSIAQPCKLVWSSQYVKKHTTWVPWLYPSNHHQPSYNPSTREGMWSLGGAVLKLNWSSRPWMLWFNNHHSLSIFLSAPPN